MARQFNGTDQGMSVAQNFSALNILSISFWLWWDSFGSGNELAMEFTADGTATDGGFTIDPNTAGSVWTQWFRTGANTHAADMTRPSAAAWHHYCVIFDIHAAIGGSGTGGTVVYVDGSSVGLTESGVVNATTFANNTLYLMCRTGSTLWGAGRMADLALWTTVLSGGNITTLAAGARANTITPAPAEYWPIGGNTSPEPEFYGGTALTLIGSPTFVADPPALPAADTTSPVCTITAPTSSTTYATALGELTTLAGTCSDNVAVTSVTWSSDKGPSGTATLAGGGTTWSIPLLPLYNGANVITVTAHDAASNTGTDSITITSTPRFAVSARTQMADEAAISPTLNYWPDSGQGIINNLDGTYTFIGSSGGAGNGTFGKSIGTFSNPLSTSAGGIVGLSGQKDTPDALAGAIHYAAGGPVYVDPASGMWITLVHYETLVHPGSGFLGTQYYSVLGLAKSNDSGDSWTDCGIIITPYHTRAEMDALWAGFGKADGSFYNAEIGWGPYLIIDGYMYVYYIYVDGAIQSDNGLTYQEGMGVARALLSDVVSACAISTVPVFHKYNAGTWTELGIHGFGSKVIPRYVGLTGSTTRDRYLGFRITNFTGSGKIEFGYYESTDGVTWTATPEIVQTADTLATNDSHWYWTVIDPDNALPLVSDDTFYICSLKRDVGSVSYGRWTVTLDAIAPTNPALLRAAAWRGAWRGEFVGV